MKKEGVVAFDEIETETTGIETETNRIETETTGIEPETENTKPEKGEVVVLSTTCYYLNGQCENVKTEFLLDSGSTFTIIDTELYKSISPKYKSELKKTDLKLKSASGEYLFVHGETTLTLKIGNQFFKKNVKVVNIGDKSAILGLDFMESESCCCWFSKGTLQVGSRGIRIPLYKMKDKQAGCARIQIVENISIPPMQEILVPGKIHPKNNTFSGKCGLVEPIGSWAETKNIAVAKALVDAEKSFIPVRIMNFSDKVVKIKAGHSLAKIHEIVEDGVKPFDIDENENTETLFTVDQDSSMKQNNTVPEHLKHLVEELPDELTKIEISQVENVVCSYADCFMTPDGKIGLTNLGQHHIDTGDARPIKLRYREPPIHVRNKVDEEIMRMEREGLIEDSDSPWSCPMVIVPKKSNEIRVCCDYRKLNDVTIKSAQNLPRINACLDSLSGAKYFC
ncbi:MAG: hypothetical protein GY705_12350, partial [Bacteroidetes bacterium]|nr:hypothetical protein [Bacteroidota bacterium]